jgi:hypothetical protein
MDSAALAWASFEPMTTMNGLRAVLLLVAVAALQSADGQTASKGEFEKWIGERDSILRRQFVYRHVVYSWRGLANMLAQRVIVFLGQFVWKLQK